MPARQDSRSQEGSNERSTRSRGGRAIFGTARSIGLPGDQQGNRDGSSNNTSHRLQSRNWPSNAARRVERINSMDEEALGQRLMEAEQARLSSLERAMQTVLSTSVGLRGMPGVHDAPQSLESQYAAYENDDEPDTTNNNVNAERMDEVSSRIWALLGRASSPDLAATLAAPRVPRQQNFPDQGRAQIKRRKIDSDKSAPNRKNFRYGQFGQVEPGQLVMEIVSCDGGMFSNESLYAAENILQNDNTVYCTKGNRCNIVLRHQGAIPFTLKELVIRGPTHMNYSHPVREGMVFVSMDHNDVLNRTAQYQIQYAPPATSLPSHSNPSDDPRDPSRGPPTEAGRSHDAWTTRWLERRNVGEARHIVSIRHHEDGSTSTRVSRHVPRLDDPEDEYRLAQMPPEFATPVPNFGVTTECSDEEEEDDAGNSRSYLLRPPDRIGNLPFEAADNELDDSEIDLIMSNARDVTTAPRGGDLSLTEAWEASNNATQEAVRAVGGELLAPHARFSIEEKKCSCTIRFDPPVTGRFILLKMWNFHSASDSNIDIQSVIARGFAGPRYFPSVQMR